MRSPPNCRAYGRFAAWGALALVFSVPAHAETLFRLDAGALYGYNLSHAHSPSDIRSDAAAAATASAGVFLPDRADSLALTLDAYGETYHRYHGLDLAAGGGRAVYRHKFGLGSEAPLLRISASVAGEDYGADIRDSTPVALTVELNRRFGESFDVAVGLFYDRRYAKNDEPDVPGISGAVFDLRGQGAYVTAGYAMTEQLLLTGKIAVRHGDVVSTSQETPQILSVATAIAEDPTFGPELYDYRLRGTTWTGIATLSYALGDSASLNLSYALDYTIAAAGLDYRSSIASLIYTYRY